MRHFAAAKSQPGSPAFDDHTVPGMTFAYFLAIIIFLLAHPLSIIYPKGQTNELETKKHGPG
jgi:hypothetical protein